VIKFPACFEGDDLKAMIRIIAFKHRFQKKEAIGLYSVVKGSNAICLARLMAIVNCR
jgi:hypothetical protein